MAEAGLRIVETSIGAYRNTRAVLAPTRATCAAHELEQVLSRPTAAPRLVSWTIGQGGSRVSAAVRAAERPRPGEAEHVAGLEQVHEYLAGGLAEPLAQRRRDSSSGKLNTNACRRPKAEQTACGKCRRSSNFLGSLEPIFHRDEPAFPGGIEQPRDPEPPMPELTGDVDLERPSRYQRRYPRGEDDFPPPRRAICRQAGHSAPPANALI